MARIAVAATAPFGADVLERLAAQHEISVLLTRPDAPQGRGRKVAPPPAKVVAERLGIPVLQPERPDAGLDLDAATVVVCAYGLLIPETLLAGRLWLNVHPSLLPRWRGAAPVERAILAGDAETGVTIHETVKELDAGPIAAQERFPIGPEDDAGAVFERAAVVAAQLLDGVLAAPSPSFVPQGADGVTYADKIAPGGSHARSRAPGSRARAAGPCALAAHRRACRAARPSASRSGGRAWGRRAPSSRSRCSRTAASGWTPRPGSAGFADGAVDRTRAGWPHSTSSDASSRTRRTPTGRCGRPPPASTIATGRSRGSSRTARCSAPARSTMRSRSPAAGRSAVSMPPVRAALRLGAYQLVFLDGVPRYAAVNESVELVRRAGLERAVPFANAVLRRLADEGRAGVEALPDSTWEEAAVAHSYPDWVAETWWRDLGADGALALMRAQNMAPATVVRLVRGEIDGVPDPDVPGAWHVEHVDETAFAEGRVWPQSAGSQLAGLAVGVGRGRAGARPLRGAGWQDDDAGRRGRRRRGERRPRARARGERARGSERRTCRSSAPTAAPCRRS